MSEAMTEQTTEQAQGQLGLELEERVILMPERLGKTAITSWPAREILTKTSGFISSYDYTLNPYRGCSFGCTCAPRPSSPGTSGSRTPGASG